MTIDKKDLAMNLVREISGTAKINLSALLVNAGGLGMAITCVDWSDNSRAALGIASALLGTYNVVKLYKNLNAITYITYNHEFSHEMKERFGNGEYKSMPR